MFQKVNLSEYAHPDLYDLENPDFEPEGSFFLSLARALGNPVLDLGCGTGRITIPMAQQGVEMTGLEIVPEMLAHARTKAGALPIQWVEADARDFHLGKKFKFIFESGSVFMHLLSNADQDAFLACAREHLAPGGRLLLSLMLPLPGLLQSEPEEKAWYTYQDQQGRNVQVSGTDQYDVLRQIKTETAIRRICDTAGNETESVAPLSLRYTFPQEMERLLDQAGFTVMERYGGPDRGPLTGASQFMVYLCASKADV